MRVKQSAILKKAQNDNFSESQIMALSREDVTVEFIQRMYKYLSDQNKAGVDKDMSAAEVGQCVDFITKRKANLSKTEFEELIYYMLPESKDKLIGNAKKFRIYHAVKFKGKYDRTSINDFILFEDHAHDLLKMYVHLLSEDIDHGVVAHIIKYLARNKSTIHFAERLFDSEIVIDDIIHNNKDSFLCILIDLDKLDGVRIENRQMADLYDSEAHKFCFNRNTIEQYFTSDDSVPWAKAFVYDEYKVADMRKKQHPFSEYISNVCKKNHMQREGYCDHDIFVDWYIGDLFQQDKLKDLHEAYKLVGREYAVEMPAWSLRVKVQPSFFVNISYCEYRSIHVCGQRSDVRSWYSTPQESRYSVNLMITPDGKIFRKYYEPKNKTIPLSMVELMSFLRKGNAFAELMTKIVDYYGRKNRFIHDVVDDCRATESCLLPASFNNVVQYHNKNEFFKANYKLARELNVNWNKKNINLAYMIIKAHNHVEPGISQRILIQIKNKDVVPEVNHRLSLNRKIDFFLISVLREEIMNAEKKAQARALKKTTQYYRNEIQSEVGTVILDDEMEMWEQDRLDDEFDTHNLQTNIADYVRMCRTTKKKVRLDVRTRQQMNNLHDLAAHGDHDNSTYYRRNTQEVKVPKNSKFTKLRTMLPDEFEWIQTRKRLILETELQHHCVWSYAQKISDDRCAIYSFVDSTGKFGFDGNPKRYTIEFMVGADKKYEIIQVQGKYDRVHTEKMREHIQGILDKNQNKEQKKVS